MKKIKFSIATSWDKGLIDALSLINKGNDKAQVDEFYGSFKTGVVGSGRPSWRLPHVSHDQATGFITHAHRNGFKFNWTLNAPDFKGKEDDAEWVKKVYDLLKWLSEIGVDILTIAHPFLINIVKKDFPEFKVTLSVIAGVDTVDKAIEFEDLGVDKINLNPHTINRDFETIAQIRSAVNCKLILYANIPCLDKCPKRDDHYRLFGYMSQKDIADSGNIRDPFIVRCSLKYLREPVQLLKSPFIRPDDISIYNDIGINRFKLSDRSEKTDFLVRTAKAYLQQNYNGDLFALVFRGGSKIKAGIIAEMPEYKHLEVPIVIDNCLLSELDFKNKIKTLKGSDLEKFYNEATERAVTVTDCNALKKIEHLLNQINTKYNNQEAKQ